MIRKILFLDVDGVLNNSTIYKRPEDNIIPEVNTIGIDKNLLENFRAIVDAHPDLEIVLSSSWRLYEDDTAWVVEAFKRAQIPFNLIGKTPRTFSGHRGREVEMWLDVNVHSTARVVAIDDDIDAGSLNSEKHKFFYARTFWEEGLTEDIAKQISSFLEYGNHIEMRG